MLQGNEGIARKYNSPLVNISDIVGDYVTFDNPSLNPEENRGALGLITLNNIEQQRNPVVMAQINNGVGLRFRSRVFSAIAHGAKGIAFWRDGGSAGPVEQQPWWNDLPDIAAEIAQMMPIIKMPHWTTWQAASSSSLIDFGTRDYNGEGYLIVSNEQDSNIPVTFTISGLAYTTINIKDYFTDNIITTVNNNQFTVSIPAYGSKVYRLEKFLSVTGEQTCLDLQLDETSGTTAIDKSDYNNNAAIVGDAYLANGILTFDGSGDYVDCNNDLSLELGTNNITVTAKVKLSAAQSDFAGIVTKGAASGSDSGYALIYRADTDELLFLISNGTTRLWLDSDNNLGINDNQWHQVTVTVARDGDAIFYVDGVAVGSENAASLNGSNIMNAGRNLLIGSWIGSWFMNGAVDNVKIYKRALSAQEVSNL
jgi:hypothetical protein